MFSWHSLPKWKLNVLLVLTCLWQNWIDVLWILNSWMPSTLYIHNLGINLMLISLSCCILLSSKDILSLIEEGETLSRLGYGTLESCFLGLAYLKAKTPKAMVEPFNTNSMTKLWMTINNNGLLIQWLSEFMNLVVIVIVLVDLYKKQTHFFHSCIREKKQCNWLG